MHIISISHHHCRSYYLFLFVISFFKGFFYHRTYFRLNSSPQCTRLRRWKLLCKWFIYITTSSTLSLPSIFCFFFTLLFVGAVLVQRRHVILMIISKRCRNMELLSIYIFMKNYTLSMPCVHQFFFSSKRLFLTILYKQIYRSS